MVTILSYMMAAMSIYIIRQGRTMLMMMMIMMMMKSSACANSTRALIIVGYGTVRMATCTFRTHYIGSSTRHFSGRSSDSIVIRFTLILRTTIIMRLLTASIFAEEFALFASLHTTIETRRDFRFAISAGSCKTSSSELLTVSSSFSIPLPSQLSSLCIGAERNKALFAAAPTNDEYTGLLELLLRANSGGDVCTLPCAAGATDCSSAGTFIFIGDSVKSPSSCGVFITGKVCVAVAATDGKVLLLIISSLKRSIDKYSRLSGKGSIASGTFGDGLFVRSFSNDRVLLKVVQLLELSFDIIFNVDTNDAVVFKFVTFVGFIIGVSPSYVNNKFISDLPMAVNFSTSVCGSKSSGGSFSDSSGNGYSAGFKCWETIFSKYDKGGTVACKSLNSFATNSIGVRGVKGPTKLGSVVSEPYISAASSSSSPQQHGPVQESESYHLNIFINNKRQGNV
uniref:Uncharacterized protein n=1 Tax=Glossina palpalis gambiensis TaxID=67801 RepID=A0A1B0BCR4_9MUSC